MNVSRRRSTLALLIAAQGVFGCASLKARTNGDVVPSSWPMILTTSRQLASESRFDVADSVLADFALHHPGTSEALETSYWRALYKMDPSSPHASDALAMESLDAYLADARPREHAVEAAILRRIGSQIDGMAKLTASAVAQAKDATTSAASVKAQAADAKALAETPSPAETELKRLKDELAKATTELERIRKRLAQPPPGKP